MAANVQRPEYERLITPAEFKAEVAKGGFSALPVRQEYATRVKANEDGSFNFVLSSATPDRSGDVVKQDGWVLDNYLRNPVVLWAHDYSCPPIAKPKALGLDGGNLVAQGVEFLPREVMEFSWLVGELYRRGFMSAVSVGFRPLEWNFADDRNGGMNFLKQELLEFSAVPVPANPEALVSAKSAGLPMRPLIEWAERQLDGSFSPGLVPRESVQRFWSAAKGAGLVQVPAAPEPTPEPTEAKLLAAIDVLVAKVASLDDAVADMAQAVDHLSQRKDGMRPCADGCCAGCVCAECKPKSAPVPTPKPTPQDVANAVGAEVQRQLAARLGRKH